ncbi:MAG: transglutaminase family protein [Acidobacteria bacterium]|nr:transglutaminase family protein [Acidobacteriota bacterium]
MIFKCSHTTRYTYEGPVAHCLSEARLTPRILENQRLLDWSLAVEPKPGSIISRKDYFGNDVSSFAVLEPHDRFTVTATSTVEILPPTAELQLGPSWEEARTMLTRCDQPDLLEASEFTWESPFVPWLEDLSAYANAVLLPGRPLLEAARELMQKIYREFQYKPAATSIETPLAEVAKTRRGVCQDYSHVMIGVLRAHGLAARYVSGYLRGDADFQGAQASHAWVSVFVPGLGWVDYDPTNNVMPSTGHLTIAWGRDFGDVTPVKGITIGGGKHELEVEVRVTPKQH